MAFAPLPGDKRAFIGFEPWGISGLSGTFTTMDAATEAMIIVGQMVTSDGASHTIDTSAPSSIAFRTGGVTFANAGTTFKVGIGDVDAAAGPPARAVNAAGVITFQVQWSGIGTGGGIVANTWTTKVPTSGSKTIANGELVAVSFQMTSRAGSDTISINNALNNITTHRPTVTSFLSSAYAATTNTPNVFITFADGATGWIYGGQLISSPNTRTFNSGSAPNEYGQLFSLPFPTTIYGVYGMLDPDGDTDIVLYSDPLGTPVAQRTASIDLNTARSAASARFDVMFVSPYDVAANAPVAAVFKPSSVTSITVLYKTLGAAAHRITDPWGTSGHAVQRSGGSGAFANSNSSLDHYYIGLLVGGFDDGVGGALAAGRTWVKHAGTWKEAATFVKQGGVWKAPDPYVKHAGVWKPLFEEVAPSEGLDIDFTTGTLDPLVTFTRTTTATRVNSSGVIVSAAIDAPRFDHSLVSPFTARGLLVEEQRTNKLILSADMSNATAWNTFVNGDGALSFGAAGTAPDGTTTAVLCSVNRSSDTEWAVMEQTFSGTAVVHTHSVYVRAKDAGNVGKKISLGIATHLEHLGAVPITLALTWQRVPVSGLLAFASTQGFYLGYLPPAASPGADPSTGLVEFYMWGAQTEEGAFATSYIPTTLAQVTRAADSAVMTGTNFSDWWNATEGTFVADFDLLAASGTRPIISADDNTAAEQIRLYASGTDPKATVTDGSATQADLDAGTLTIAGGGLGLAFAANDFAACFNGGTVALDTGGTLPTVNQLRIGYDQAGNYLNGHFARLQFFNTAKTDVELQALTA